jgi:hypothetical protein
MSDTSDGLDLRLTLAQIDLALASHDRTRQEIQLAPWQIVISLVGGAAAFFAAGAAFTVAITRGI